MTLTGIFKNILLIIVSIIIWRTKISLLQGFGYSIALAGLTYYSVGYDQLARAGSIALAWSAGALGPATSGGRSASALNTRRLFLVAGFAISGLFIIIMALRHYDPKAKGTFSLPAFFGTE